MKKVAAFLFILLSQNPSFAGDLDYLTAWHNRNSNYFNAYYTIQHWCNMDALASVGENQQALHRMLLQNKLASNRRERQDAHDENMANLMQLYSNSPRTNQEVAGEPDYDAMTKFTYASAAADAAKNINWNILEDVVNLPVNLLTAFSPFKSNRSSKPDRLRHGSGKTLPAETYDYVPSQYDEDAPVASEKGTEFVVSAPNAQKVAIAGSFNGWKADQYYLEKGENGEWQIQLPLKPGSYDYKFLQDGNWDTLNKRNRKITVTRYAGAGGIENAPVRHGQFADEPAPLDESNDDSEYSQTFADRARLFFPGTYDGLVDDELEARILIKYSVKAIPGFPTASEKVQNSFVALLKKQVTKDSYIQNVIFNCLTNQKGWVATQAILDAWDLCNQTGSK